MDGWSQGVTDRQKAEVYAHSKLLFPRVNDTVVYEMGEGSAATKSEESKGGKS